MADTQKATPYMGEKAFIKRNIRYFLWLNLGYETPQQLADRLDCSTSATNKQLRKARELNLLTRKRNTSDPYDKSFHYEIVEELQQDIECLIEEHHEDHSLEAERRTDFYYDIGMEAKERGGDINQYLKRIEEGQDFRTTKKVLKELKSSIASEGVSLEEVFKPESVLFNYNDEHPEIINKALLDFLQGVLISFQKESSSQELTKKFERKITQKLRNFILNSYQTSAIKSAFQALLFLGHNKESIDVFFEILKDTKEFPHKKSKKVGFEECDFEYIRQINEEEFNRCLDKLEMSQEEEVVNRSKTLRKHLTQSKDNKMDSDEIREVIKGGKKAKDKKKQEQRKSNLQTQIEDLKNEVERLKREKNEIGPSSKAVEIGILKARIEELAADTKEKVNRKNRLADPKEKEKLDKIIAVKLDVLNTLYNNVKELEKGLE